MAGASAAKMVRLFDQCDEEDINHLLYLNTDEKTIPNNEEYNDVLLKEGTRTEQEAYEALQGGPLERWVPRYFGADEREAMVLLKIAD